MNFLKKFLGKKSETSIINYNEPEIKITKDLKETTDIDNELYNKTVYANVRFLYCFSDRDVCIEFSSNNYPSWMLYECGILDPNKKYKELVKEGYLQLSPISNRIAKFKVSELKDILKNNNIDFNSKDKKADLIKNLELNLDKVKIELPELYTLSEKGKKYVQENYEMLEAHGFSKYDISMDEYYKHKLKFKYKISPRDIAWSIFNERILSYMKTNSFGLLRNNYFYMAEFLINEKKSKDALQQFIIALYYDFYDIYGVAPGLVKRIYDLKSFYDPIMVERCKKIYAPPKNNKASFKKFESLLQDIFLGEELSFINKKYFSE